MSEQELRETMSAIDINRAQLDNVSRQQEMVRLSVEEHLRAHETLAQYFKAEENEEILVPIGAGVFLHARVGNKTSCIAPVGAGVMMEKEMADITKMLDKQIEELKKASTELAEQAEKISYAIEELSKNAREQYNTLQQPSSKMKSK